MGLGTDTWAGCESGTSGSSGYSNVQRPRGLPYLDIYNRYPCQGPVSGRGEGHTQVVDNE